MEMFRRLKNKKDLLTAESCKHYDYDIILIAGQSNAQGCGKGYEELKYIPHNPIYGYTPDREFHLACDTRYGRKNHCASFSLYFGQEYCNSGMLKQSRKLLLLNCALGGTGFSDNRWGDGDDLYELTLRLAGKILDLNSENRITAFLWHQGETDALNNMSGNDYLSKLQQLIIKTRHNLDIEKVPFICGNMVPVWMRANPHSYEIAEAQRKLTGILPGCGFVESEGLTGNETPDIIHFSRKSCAELGKRYFEKYKSIKEYETGGNGGKNM